jgi:hypothetical protein
MAGDGSFVHASQTMKKWVFIFYASFMKQLLQRLKEAARVTWSAQTNWHASTGIAEIHAIVDQTLSVL